MSGRREAQVLSDARLMGQTSYIYEAGCGVVIEGERTLADRRVAARRGRDPRRADARRRHPGPALRAASRAGSSGTPPGTRAASSRTCSGARSTWTRRTPCSPSTATTDLRFLDNGAISRPMAGIEVRARLPPGPGRRQQGEARWAATCAPGGTRPESASPSATRSRTSSRPRRSGASSSSPTAPSATRTSARRSPRFANVTVTEGSMGDGFYEAVVSTLRRAALVAAGRRGRAAHPRQQAVGERAARRRSGRAGGRRAGT